MGVDFNVNIKQQYFIVMLNALKQFKYSYLIKWTFEINNMFKQG